MPLTLNCPKCHKPFRVRDESVGGRVRCPSCGAVLQVPAALSQASSIGLDLPRVDSPSGEMTGAHRPVAEDVPPSSAPAASMPDMMLGGAGRMDGAGAAGTALPSPPSIKGRGEPPPRSLPTAPPTNASLPAMPRPNRVPPAPRPAGAPWNPVSALPPDLATAWAKVRGGLGLVRWGLFLCLLPLVLALGHAAWIVFDQDSAMKPGPGLLGREDLPRVKEVSLAYTAIPFGLAALCLFFGRLKCGAAPAETRARGLARGAAFFTFLALLGIGVYIAQTYFDAGNKAKVPANILPHVLPIATVLILPSILLAELLTLLFVGQIGWPVGRPTLQKGVAGFFLTALLIPPALVIAERFYPVYDVFRAKLDDQEAKGLPNMLLAAFTGDDDAVANRMMIWTVILTAAILLIVLRYAGVLGAGRRAIRRYIQGDV